MSLSASDRIDQILSGKQIHPFDWVNLPLFYDPRPEEDTDYTNRLRAATKIAYVAANEMGYGLSFVFRPSAMSNGTLAYDLANDCTSTDEKNILAYGMRRFGRPIKTTQNMKNTVAGSEIMNRVVLKNRERDFRAANKLEVNFPDKAVVVPIEFENAPRTQRGNNALSQGASFQDWTFENWWGPRVMDMEGFVYGGNKRFESRYLCIEDMIGTAIQCGFLDDKRDHACSGKKFDVTDENGKQITLADRSWGRAKHIFDRTEDNFAVDLAAATLLAEFQIDDWLRGEGKPKGFKLDKKAVHPVLAKRTKKELDRMDRLKAIMLPYIAEKCLDLIPYQEDPNLKKYVEEKVIPAKGRFSDLDMDEVRKVLFSEKIIGDLNESDVKKADPSTVSKAFDDVSQHHTRKAAKRRSVDGGYFKSKSRLFDDSHFAKLSVWEQAALPFIMGAIESFRLPEQSPVQLFFINKSKGGTAARDYMDKNKIDYLREAYSHRDQKDPEGFVKKVIEKNKKRVGDDLKAIASTPALVARGVKNIVGSHNFANIAAAVNKNRKFVAAKGADDLSPRAVLAMEMEVMARNSQACAVRKDWATNHDEVMLVTQALQIAVGLIKRPFDGGETNMELFSYDEKTKTIDGKLDLYDLITDLGKETKRLLEVDAPAREHYLSLARMVQIFDMHADVGRMNAEIEPDKQSGAKHREEIIEWRNVDEALLAFWDNDPDKREGLKAFAQEIKAELIKAGAKYFEEHDLDGLHEDYRAAWNKAHGLDTLVRRSSYDGRRTGLLHEGPA